MPLIKNKYYAEFIIQKAEKENKSTKTVHIDYAFKDKLDEWLNDLPNQKKPRKCSTQQARALLLLLYYSGCRESEAVQLMGQGIVKTARLLKNKQKKYFYEVDIPALKGGKNERLYLAINEHTEELYNYCKGIHPRERAFYSFYSPQKNTVRYQKTSEMLVKTPNLNGTFTLTKEKYKETKSKQYTRVGGKVYKYVNLWTERTPHFFRHNRFSIDKANGWSNEQIMRFKRATSYRSIQPYLHITPEYLDILNKQKND